MASLQCHKPCEQTNHTKTCQTNHNKHTNEHSFTDKVKEMTHKIYHPHGHPNHTQLTNKPTNNNCFTGPTAHHHEKKHNMKKTEGHDGHCMPKLLDHNMKMKKKKSHNKRAGGYNDDSGSSSDESDNESCKNKC
ncbi:hypothetical protein CASFOL_002441 [Castilleja foliolosa]|uniref:Uncharacterized protein n=1 Tax=Castilleja foliolosa TaxID=1961234 RepID=A0ABD3EEJ7_9LAMI